MLAGAWNNLAWDLPIERYGCACNMPQHVNSSAPIQRISATGHSFASCSLSENSDWTFHAPHSYRSNHEQLQEECWSCITLNTLKASEGTDWFISKTGYGLTLGLKSRIDSRLQHVANPCSGRYLYVNRSMTGAVVGVQPFGGEGFLDCPKAGGPPTICVCSWAYSLD